MAELFTGYEDDELGDTIECLTCFKQIRGDTQYKIHVTTPQHLKREEAQAINDLGPPPRPLPEWTDILQYLNYLQLKEPIIGLDSLVQQDDALVDGKPYLKYRCKMCNVESIMCTMVSHIVSRKHRYRYLQLKRPDLLPRISVKSQKQPGLVARAKAAIAEKQDGWGTPLVLKRPKVNPIQPQNQPILKQENQGFRAAQASHSYTLETSSHGQDWRGQARLPEDSYRQPDFAMDVFGKPTQFHGDGKNDSSRSDLAHWQSYPNNDRSENAHHQDDRQRLYQDEGYKEKAYLEGDGSVRSFVVGDVDGRRQTDRAVPGRSYRDERQDEYYTEMDPRRGWNPSVGVQEDLYHGSISKNRFADTERSGSSQHPEMIYQVEGHRGHSMEEMQRPSTSFQYVEKERDYVQNMIREARAVTYELQDYAKRSGLGDYAQEYVPAKKKRPSRFSDATPKEVELAQKRYKEGVIPPKNQIRGQVQAFEERMPSYAMHTTVNSDNVLDVLDGVQIDTAEEANFLKQKLCDVLKEFHASKSHRAEVSPGIREYSPRSDIWLDHRRGVQETRKLEDLRGFSETTRYDHDHRDFQEQRMFTNNPTGVQETWRPGQNTRDIQDPRCVEDQRHIQDMWGKEPYQETTQYENRSTDFRGGCLEDNRMAFQKERGLYDNSRDVQQAGRFEDNHPSYQQTIDFKEISRAGRVEENPRSFQSMRHTRGTEKTGGFEEHFERDVVGRHGDRDFRHVRSDLEAPREFEWDSKRERSAGRPDEFKDCADVDRRAYQEDHWNSRSLREEDKPYIENQVHMPHYQRNLDPSVELYDPFQPSSSPPPQAAPPPSSLEKLASTLLELVSRNSN